MESNANKILNELEEKIKKGHKKYTIDFKLKVIELVHLKFSIHFISNKLNIDRKSIREWLNNEDSLKLVSNKDKKFRSNRNSNNNTYFTPEEESKIYNWIIECRNGLKPVSTKSVISFAGNIKNDFSNKTMNTKLQWTYRFLKRYGFSIRRISHKGQSLPESKDFIKKKFIADIITKRQELGILPDEDYRILNMDETPCNLEMGFETTIDFIGKKSIEIETLGREQYRITIILTIAGDGTKLPPFVILKGKPGKIIENHVKNLEYVVTKKIFVCCQENGWCTEDIFADWIKNIFIPYQISLKEKCLLIFDKASSHVSKNSIELLKKHDINYVTIPAGMTPITQPLDIAVNKTFKDHIKLLFEKERLLYDNILAKTKLDTARINLLNYINYVWNIEEFITNSIIVNGFKKAGIIGNSYLSKDEEKIREGYIYDLGLNNNLEIIDDLAEEYNLINNENELNLEEASDELLDNDKQNIENKEYQDGNDYKNEISNLEGKFEFNNIEYMDLDN